MAMPLLWAGTGGRKLGARVLQWTKRLKCPRGQNKLFKGEPEVCYWVQVLQDWEARTKGTGNGQEPGGDGGGEGSGRRVQWNVPDRLWQGVFSAGGPWPCGLEAGLSVCSYGVGRVCMGAQSLSHVWLFVTPGIVAAKLLHTCFFFFFPPGKNTGVDCHFLLQGTILTQELNLCLLRLRHWKAGSLSRSHVEALMGWDRTALTPEPSLR